MGLFNWFRRNGNQASNGIEDIPEHEFIDNTPPAETNEESIEKEDRLEGIELIYSFLREDYEVRGYNDAMTNPDSTYREDNIKLLRHDLALRIDEVDNYYSDLKNSLQFHIQSRSRSGLIDMVEALQTKLTLLDEHIEKLERIKKDSANHEGVSERIILSYQRGFARGLASLSHAEILSKKL